MNPVVRRQINVLVVVAALFGALGVVARHHVGGLLADDRVDHDLLASSGSLGWHFGEAASWLASGPVVGLLAVVGAVVLLWRRRPVAAFAMFAAPALAGVLEVVLKAAIGRPRPLTSVLTGESGDGFPSGHVSGFAALALIVVLIDAAHRREQGWQARHWPTAVALAAVIVVAVSRVVVGAHYASDTVGGALLGAMCALAVAVVVPVLAPIVVNRRRPTPPS